MKDNVRELIEDICKWEESAGYKTLEDTIRSKYDIFVKGEALTAEEGLIAFGKFLNQQGYNIDLYDDFWMEDCLFSDHKVRDIFELCDEYVSSKEAGKNK